MEGERIGEGTMTEEQFVDALMEEILIRGFICPPVQTLALIVSGEWERLGESPDPAPYAERCVQFLGLSNRHANPVMGIASATAGAREEWLAVHEAGHAIVGLNAGLKLWGVRFYNDGFPGEAFFQDPEWWKSTDEDLLRRLITVDVAGNMAQLLYSGCPAPQGLLSRQYDDRTPGDRPTDFISADARARHLAIVLLERDGKELDTKEIWRERRASVERAEAEAGQILRDRHETLVRLVEELRCGPMTGVAVRAIVGGDAVP
jgi:hypothetical protein